MIKVFIDGNQGTTGLRIIDRLAKRKDIELLLLSNEERKDIKARAKMLNSCDVAFLCLPDDAAKEAITLIENPNVIVIDTSTAHRTESGWAYGFAELDITFEQKIKNSKRIANPGCHASGFIALTYPLIKENVIDKDILLSCFSITGYSGGGKKMIGEYECEEVSSSLLSPRCYGLTQNHKHLKEMKIISGLENEPIFSPIVSNFYSGMVVSVPIFNQQLKGGKTIQDIMKVYKRYYNGNIVKYIESIDENGIISSNKLANKDSMEITVLGNSERIVLCARYDNLGKGASGSAIECMNIALNLDKSLGLEL